MVQAYGVTAAYTGFLICPCCVTVVGDILMIAEDISKCPCCKVRNKRNICNRKEDSGVIRNRRSITNSSLGIKPHSDIGGMIYAFVNVFREPTNYSEIQLDYLTNAIINAIKFHDQPPADLLYIFDVYSSKVHLNGLKTVINSSHNITFLIADATPEHPIRGFRYIKNTDLNDTKSNYKFLTEESNREEFLDNDSKVVVLLPESINKSPHRISFIVFEEGLFHENTNSSLTVNSVVVDINIDNVTTFENGEVIDIHLRPFIERPPRGSVRNCAYWKFLENDTGYWSTEGCTFVKTKPGVMDICRCNHLTHFAEVLVPRTLFSKRNEDILEILSIIGCGLSLFGVTVIMLTALVFPAWRKEFGNKIWLQLCFAIFLISLCFIFVVLVKVDEYDIQCMIVGAVLHYSVLKSFCWMLVSAVITYRKLVVVFTTDVSRKLLKASAFSWGAPIVIVGILFGVDPLSYAGQFEDKSPSGKFCYPSGLGLWLAVYAPVVVILVSNTILFILIVRSVFASRNIQAHRDPKEAIRSARVSCFLVFLFGLPWLFGIFANYLIATYIFTCTVTLQGFVLFIFIVVANKKTRDMWLDKLNINHSSKITETTPTSVNRSVGSRLRDIFYVKTSDPSSVRDTSVETENMIELTDRAPKAN
ncbi:adhesion G-protein coupled receptor G2-like [Achroia grisella]|uniref:adhesion G-protein coupled receptor G2-like n=1 Tax=Achroia grisella TaxID=688607 RepID=UPI0027D1FF75|nr:adhesion G-protein coupled receptor G2-like [Achroia grisella]